MIDAAARLALQDVLGDGVRFEFPMSRCTSLRVGGPADALATPADREELARTLAACAAHRIPHTTIGAGFNTLVLDGGLDGVVIQLSKLRRLEERPGRALRVETGVSHNQLIKFCIARGLGGLAYGAGIPGTIGGWLAMNAGIPARETGDVVREIEVMSPTGGSLSHIGCDRLRFVYRSVQGLAPGSVLVSSLLEVTLATREEVQEEVDALLARRAASQPLDVPSCGSVFKNPRGDFAGRLIEATGLKGFTIGGAQISPTHANFITNLGGASAGDVLALIEMARSAVHEATGIRLTPEVRIVGRKT
jgi:UDP-N-acetylmuramate dehydrogenase